MQTYLYHFCLAYNPEDKPGVAMAKDGTAERSHPLRSNWEYNDFKSDIAASYGMRSDQVTFMSLSLISSIPS